jgi:hypothetical protein
MAELSEYLKTLSGFQLQVYSRLIDVRLAKLWDDPVAERATILKRIKGKWDTKLSFAREVRRAVPKVRPADQDVDDYVIALEATK